MFLASSVGNSVVRTFSQITLYTSFIKPITPAIVAKIEAALALVRTPYI